jgi:hypothetical protein
VAKSDYEVPIVHTSVASPDPYAYHVEEIEKIANRFKMLSALIAAVLSGKVTRKDPLKEKKEEQSEIQESNP